MNFNKILPKKVKRFFNVGNTFENEQTISNLDQQIELSKVTASCGEPQPGPSSVIDQNDLIEVKEQTTHQCENLMKALQIFELTSIQKKLEESDNVLLLKFEISENFSEIDSTKLLELAKKCIKNSVVIFFASQSDDKFIIYWKSNEIGKLLTIKSYDSDYMRTSRILFEFIAKFLTKSLKNKHLGLRKFDGKHETTEFELHFLADHREFNILLVAADMGDVIIVGILMKLWIETESPFKNINAQSLAYHGQHYQVLLLLFHENLPFPVGMNVSKCSIEVQNFVKMCNRLHELIKVNNVNKITKIVQKYSHLRYFYNQSNESALTIALRCNSMLAYEALLVNDVKFGPHEKTKNIMEALKYETQEAAREIHFKLSKDMSENHIGILMANSSIGHDVPEPKEKFDHVQNAFIILNTIPLVRTILIVVAASRKFKIIFDFNRDTVHVADPTSDSFTNGIFYESGRIYIGARQLLDEVTRSIALGTLAHELFHYALNLTFENDAKPYGHNEIQTMQEFEEISKYCEEHREKEKIVKLVYSCYPKDMFHAELAVRVPHLMVLYHGQPVKLQESRANFNELFEFIEQKVAPQMIKAIPDIESKVDRDIEKKDKKISKLKRNFYIAIVIGVIIAALVGVFFYTPTYKFNELSEQKQSQVKNGHVLYKNVKVKLIDFFVNNSKIYDNITSNHIGQLLDGEVLNFDDPHMRYLDEFVSFDWKNLAGNLKKKVLKSGANFQGQNVKFSDLSQKYKEVLSSLTSQDLKDILNGTRIVIGEKLESKVKFYLERKFIPEDSKMMNFEYTYGHEYIDDYYKRSEHIKKRIANKTFQEFSDEFLQNSFDDRLKIFDKVRENFYFKELYFDLNADYFKSMHKNTLELIVNAENEKILILSSEAGAGKTVTFENLAIKMKQQNPTQWVSYIDLKDLKKYYKTGSEQLIAENVQKLLESILNLNRENKFESKIFEVSFMSGNVVLLWNGFDEISQKDNKFVMNLIKFIHENSENVQFVCTRPLYSEQLAVAYTLRTWQLIPFSDDEVHEFLRQIFISENAKTIKVEAKIQRIEKLIEKLQFAGKSMYNFNSPLMLKMVAEISEAKNFSESANLYEIFEAFVDKKIQIWLDRSENSQIKARNVKHFGTISKLHQKYALLDNLHILSLTLELKLKTLQIMQTEIPEDLPLEEISSMGILYINGKNKFEFAHRTFSEFFIAQYFIENIYNADNNVNNKEAELRIELFFKLTQAYGSDQKIVTDFISSYLEMNRKGDKKISQKNFQLFKTKFRNFFFRMLDTNSPEVFDFLFQFFKRDQRVLTDLLHINEHETLFTASFNPNYFGLLISPEKIKSLAQNCLTDEEFKKFLNGKNQKGIILFGMNFYKLLGRPKVYGLYEEESETLNGTSFWEFFDKINESLTDDEQKELFVTALSPKFYLFYDKMFSTSDFPEYEKLWTNYEGLLSQSEMQYALGNALIQYSEIRPEDSSRHEPYLSLLLEKADKFLSNSQIFQMFLTKNILHEAHWHSLSFEALWNFLKNHTTAEERRMVLLQDDFDDKNLYFYYSYDEEKKIFSSYKYRYYCYDFTPFKIFHRSLTVPNAFAFDFTKKIYEENFDNETEIQDMILSSNDFIYYAIGMAFVEDFGKFVSFLDELFKGSEHLLKEFLERKIEPTNLSIIEYVEELRTLPGSEPDWFTNLKTLTDLYDIIKNF